MCDHKRHDQAFEHPFRCNGFIYCWEGRGMSFKFNHFLNKNLGFEIFCRPGMNFNPNENRCDANHYC